MNEIASGPVSAVPLVTTHVDRTRQVIETEIPNQKKVIEEITVIDTYDWRGIKSSATKEHSVSWIV